MKSFTLTALFLVLTALFATPIVGDYVERRGYDQGFGALEVRAPVPGRRRGGSSGDEEPTATGSGAVATATNFAPANIVNLAGVGAMAVAAGAAVMY